jgi:hypothetical protein
MVPAALAAYGPGRLTTLMRDARDVLARHVEPAALDQAYRRYLARGAPGDAARVWRLATLALWLRRAAS